MPIKTKPQHVSLLLEQALRAARSEPQDSAPDDAAVKFSRAAWEYERCDARARATLREKMSPQALELLVALSARCALEALATRDPSHLRSALIALSIGDFAGDARETQMVLAVVWYACRALSVSSAELFSEVAELCTAESRHFLGDFLSKSDDEKSLAAMGILDAYPAHSAVGLPARSRQRLN